MRPLLLLFACLALVSQVAYAGPVFSLLPAPGTPAEGTLWSPNLYWKLTNSQNCGPIVVGQNNEVGWWLDGDVPATAPVNATYWSLMVTEAISYNLNLNPTGWWPGIMLARGSQLDNTLLTSYELLSPNCPAIAPVGYYTRWFFKGAYGLAISNSGVLMRRNIYGDWVAITDEFAFVFLQSNGVQIYAGTWSGVLRRGPDWINIGGTDITQPKFGLNLPTATCVERTVFNKVEEVKNYGLTNLTYRRTVQLTIGQRSEFTTIDATTLTLGWNMKTSTSVSGKTFGAGVEFSIGQQFDRERSTTLTNTADFSRMESTQYEINLDPGQTLYVFNDTMYKTCTFASSVDWTYCNLLWPKQCYTLPFSIPLTTTSYTSALKFMSNP